MENDSDEYINELISQNSQSKKKSKKRYLFEKLKNTFYYDNIALEKYNNERISKNIPIEIVKTSDEKDNIVINNIIKENLDKNKLKRRKLSRKKNSLDNNIILKYDGIQNLRSALIDLNMNISINIITTQKINDFFILMRDFLTSETDKELYLELKNLTHQIMWKIINKILSTQIFNNLIINMKYTLRDILLNLLEKNINI